MSGEEVRGMENKELIARSKSRNVKVVQVILVETVTGEGTKEDPLRVIYEYWSLDGVLLAVSDPPECPVF